MREFFKVILWTALVLGVIIGVARFTVLRWWQVPLGDPALQASIAPTLRGGDWVILWRASAPHFGDLVLCPEPGAAGRVAIGRIIGEGGDVVELEGQNVIVNGKRAEIESACSERTHVVRDPVSGAEVTQICQMEAIGGVLHKRGMGGGERMLQTRSKHTVQPGFVFLVSDNRQHPWDSRRYGGVELRTCTETIIFRLWSKDGFLDVKNRLTYIR